MRSRLFRALVVCVAASVVFALRSDVALRASSSGVVISQVYGGGGNSGATYKNDFIELFNAGPGTVSLSGWSVQYASAAGTSWQVTALSGSLAPGQYYLVQEAAGAGGTVALPTPDAIGTGTGIAMSATAGKVALVAGTSALAVACPAGVVDLVGYGTTANCFEGSGPTPAPANATAVLRASNGCTDTDSNASDFSTGTPTPRNSSTSLVVCATSTNLGVSASATPSSVSVGGATTLTVNVTPGSSPASTGIAVVADLTAIGGANNQAFAGSGNTFTYSATVASLTTPGAKSLPVSVTDAEGRSASTSIALTVTAVVPSTAPVVVSQIYAGGGNSGAAYKNDYVELFNRTTSTVDVTGWSLQYGPATSSSWLVQALAGTIGPGEYFLIKLGSNSATGADIPPANVDGSASINLSASSGKVALVGSAQALSGCPATGVVDLVGYGTTANCREGANAPSPGDNATALLRLNGGATDTDRNDADFVPGTPNPRRTAPFIEVGPTVLNVDPAPAGTDAPRDATMTITFSEPVTVTDPWYDVTCALSGQHNSATSATGSLGAVHTITPNTNFTPGETCTVTIAAAQVSDVDTDDSAPGTDHLPANYVWSFAVATGNPPPYPPEVHLAMGNPSGAAADVTQPDNYLMMKPEFALSYNRDLGRPNWVSWHLTDEWYGTLARNDTFRPDPAVPPEWYRVQAFDFSGSGFDRGHMTPNADRDREIPINQATFLMSNMVAQSPDNNQGPWANLENYLRAVAAGGNELYIVSGPLGEGGTGSNGFASTVANGHVTVPAYTWKVALVLPKLGGDDVARVDCSARSIAVLVPNVQGIRTSDPSDWMAYLTTVRHVEDLTGYNFFSNVPVPFQDCVELGTNGDNPPLVKGSQTITFPQPADATYGDLPFSVAATGGPSGNPVTFAASGACSASGQNGSTITVTSAGSCSITASQAGSAAYDAAADVTRTLAVTKAAAQVSVTGYTGTYDGSAHGATGTALGLNNENLAASLNLGATFANVPGGTAHWTFSNANYADQSGDVAITITRAAPTLTDLASPTIGYGTAQTPLSGHIASGTLVPTGSVAITLNGVTQNAAIQPDGSFSATFATGSLPPVSAGYAISYAYAGDVNFSGAEGAGTLTIGYGVTPLYDATRAVNGGSTLPIRLILTNASGGNVSSPAIVVTAVRLVQVSTSASAAVQDSGNANPDGNFRFDGSAYIFNLSTKGLSTGTYNLVFTVTGDPTSHAVSFQVR